MVTLLDEKTIRCPGCGGIYHLDSIEKQVDPIKIETDYSTYVFSFSCITTTYIGGLPCSYNFNFFKGEELADEQSRNFYDEEWSLFQKHRFYNSQLNFWIVVFWQQSFTRFVPIDISDVISINIVSMLINQSASSNSHIPIVAGFNKENHKWEIKLKPDNRVLSKFYTDEYIDSIDLFFEEHCNDILSEYLKHTRLCYKYGDKIQEHSALSEIYHEELSQQPSIIAVDWGDIFFIFPLWVGSEVVGFIIFCGCRFPSHHLKSFNFESNKYAIVNAEWLINNEDITKDLIFQKNANNTQNEINRYNAVISNYTTMSVFADDIIEICRSTYDRKRKPNDEYFMREIVSRLERRYETRFEPDKQWEFVEETLNRISDYLDISRIVYLTSEYHPNRLVARIDSEKTFFKPEGAKSFLPGSKNFDKDLRVRINTDLNRLIKNRLVYFFIGYYHIKRAVFFDRKKAIRPILDCFKRNDYAKDEDILCLAPINISMLGPTNVGLLVFMVRKNQFNYSYSRELYGRIVRVLTIIFRKNYAEQARRNEYGRAIHEILEPHGAITSRLDRLKNLLRKRKKYNKKFSNSLNIIDTEVKLTRTLKDSLSFGKRLVYITDKMKLNLENSEIVPEKKSVRISYLFTRIFGQLKGLAKENDLFMELKSFLEKTRGRDVFVDEKLTEQVIYHTLINAVKYSIPKTNIIIEYEENLYSQKFRISNISIPVPKGERERIFNPFTRGSNANFFDAKGSGEGCSFSRKVMNEQGGWYRYYDRDPQGDRNDNPPTLYQNMRVKEVIFEIGIQHEDI